MRRFVTFVGSSALLCAMSVAPALADTSTATTSTTTTAVDQALSCFTRLLTDPAKHAQECGGPNFSPAPPPSSGGDGTACPDVTEIAPYDLPDLQIKSDAEMLVAPLLPCRK